MRNPTKLLTILSVFAVAMAGITFIACETADDTEGAAGPAPNTTFVISAGTGSGGTKTFYPQLNSNGTRWYFQPGLYSDHFTAPPGTVFYAWEYVHYGGTTYVWKAPKLTDVDADYNGNGKIVWGYQITYDLQGGIGAFTTDYKVAAQPGTSASAPFKVPLWNVPAQWKPGNIFIGWKINNTGSLIAPGQQVNVSSATTFYAQWTDQVQFTFNANGGSGSMASISQTIGIPFNLPNATFTAPAGMEFVGWRVGNTGGTIAAGTEYIPNQSAATLTLYAQWAELGATLYTISYDLGSVDGFIPPRVVVSGDQMTAVDPFNYVLAPGLGFTGWKVGDTTQILGSGQYFTPTGSVTLHAVWYNLDNGSVSDLDSMFILLLLILMIIAITAIIGWRLGFTFAMAFAFTGVAVVTIIYFFEVI